MKKLLYILILASLLIGVASAQNTTVTATVVDSDSTTWANGTWSISFRPSPNFPSPSQYNINSSAMSPSVINQSGTLSSSGALSVVIYDSTQVSPSGSGWTLTLCSNTSAACNAYNFSTSGSSMNISSALTAALAAPRFKAIAGSYGYADVEASLQLNPGSTYWNVTNSTARCYTGSAWQNCVTSGVCTVFSRISAPVALTGVTSETVIQSVQIPANTLTTGAYIELYSNVNGAAGNTGTFNYIIRFGTLGTTGDTALASTSASSSANSVYALDSTASILGASSENWKTYTSKTGSGLAVVSVSTASSIASNLFIDFTGAPSVSGDTNTLNQMVVKICKP